MKKDDGRMFCMKITLKSNMKSFPTSVERCLIEKMEHPFLENLRYSFQNEDKLFLVYDYIAGGELFYYVQQEHRFEENTVRFYAAQVVCILSHLHSMGEIYQELTPEVLSVYYIVLISIRICYWTSKDTFA